MINQFIESHSILLVIGLVGCLVGFLYELWSWILASVMEHVGNKRPGFIAGMYEKARRDVKRKYAGLVARVRGVIWRIVAGAVSLFVAWGCILFALNAVGLEVFASPREVNLRSSIAYAFGEGIGWFLRGQGMSSFGQLQGALATFQNVDSITSFGRVLKFVMLGSIPLLLIAKVERFWRWTSPGTDQ